MNQFLCDKPLYYDSIDYTRFPKAYNLIKDKLKLTKIIHVVGTNAKGSTGRFLAQILKASGKKVGHFTSPHIFTFNDRFWIDGNLASDDQLQKAHQRLLSYFLSSNAKHFIEKLSYFEWATLLAAVLFEDCDEVILEAGMGGEHDATNVFSKKLSIFTTVSLDHVDMLGDTIEKIAFTKLNSMDKLALISSDFAALDIAKQIAKSKNCKLIICSNTLYNEVVLYKEKFSLPNFLASNLNLALNAALILGLSMKDCKKIVLNLNYLSLRGRCEIIKTNLTIDVGHNAEAAKALVEHFKDQRIYLIYNAFDDKDVEAVLKEFKPIVLKLLIYEYKEYERKLATKRIQQIAKKLKIPCENFTHLDDAAQFLVFGSFKLVEHFIGEVIEKK